MNASTFSVRLSSIIAVLLIVVLSIAEPLDTLAGKSFGGRRSFGGSRSSGRSFSSPSRPSSSFGGSRSTSPYSAPRQSQSPSSSFGGSRSTSPYSAPRQMSPSGGPSSFGGTRLGSREQYTRSYGVPRSSEQRMISNSDGSQTRTVVHNYGGVGDGFAMGYLMGNAPFWWSTPFHPAFYYSRPQYYHNPNGTVEVYPGRFSFSSVVMVVIIVGSVAFIGYRIIRNRRRGRENQPGIGATSSFE
ncbi:hypothetical protein MASR2M18_07120 [Ignavibacteria bacterium]|nr:hypothetical protein [Bacteroidota bacterium]MCZ2132101.1 hypothetical protein [Bacteroidota bacterium]